MTTEKVTRFEVIDHTRHTVVYRPPDSRRLVVTYGVHVEVSLQDDGKTLKVFLTDE